MTNQELARLHAHVITELFAKGELSPIDLMRTTLDAIALTNPSINAFQHVDAERALDDAKASHTRWQRGEPLSPLDGLPVSIKDLVPVAGWPTRYGSLTSATSPSLADAPSVARLREAGAVLFGKTTTPEFGWKGLTDSPLAGATRNPWDLSRSAGGSSGGAAASVAAGINPMAHGNDGGGSVRIPASYCGLFGFKPSFGRVPDFPRAGAYETMASEGPLSRSVRDAALFLNVICRPDHRDWYALPYDGRDYLEGLDTGVAGLRIGLTTSLGGREADPHIAAAIRQAGQVFTDQGARVEEVRTIFEPLRPVFERFWLGGLFQRVAAVPVVKRHLIDPELLRVAADGEDVSLSEYALGMTERARLGATMSEWHQTYDLLLCPTMPTDPPPVDTVYHSDAFDRWDHATPYSVPFNLTGQPAASIPCGYSPAGLPIGLQIVADRFDDALVLRASRAYERDHPILAAPPVPT